MNIDTTNIEKILSKLAKKDKILFMALTRKIAQIGNMNGIEIDHLKNLKGNMSHLKRVHVGSFVLTFSIQENTIIFKDFVHHDSAY